jgi:hypothetical protein
MSKWGGRVTPLDALVLVFFDQSIPIELRLLLDILYEWPRFSLLKEVVSRGRA